MKLRDIFKLTSSSLIAHRLRSLLTATGIAVGIAAVVLLTSIGEGLQQFVMAQFTQFGTTIIAVNPGKATTAGTSVGVFGTERPLTLEDALALGQLPEVEAVVPFVQGNAEVEAGSLHRRTTVYGAGPEMPKAFRISVSMGRFLPLDNPLAPRALAVLGSKMRSELFQDTNPLGQLITIAGSRFRVVGVMESKGSVLGFDLDDTVYIPAARAMELFNTEGLIEIDVMYAEGNSVTSVVNSIRNLLRARHGRDEVTITTQQQMLEVLGGVLDMLTFAVAAIGSISLLVGAIGIVTIMTIGVNERTGEIGLLRALGARQSQVLSLFLGEAVVLAAAGGIAGLLLGAGLGQLLRLFVPGLPVQTSLFYVLLAEAVAIVIGLIAGVLPAQRAARLDPVEALRTE
ncbi:macrolide export ATP-binding/permease protein MacB 1 [Luminiphilus syltensis NOR5-1B]|uniref:Macrolide export ATP-binding/permease protein MacB 1 n=1 Tax=Luminiphilus syltensis NOR5-1B TaxID=565045 RepID=B8KV98_9GAMM|nr:ABC transporter permease [Luminiphilus syltensis]EED35248.1 macrolide export ATP-binding/permease protein MacB 1 [Luminiphilus syltensis NOR5-1B]